MIHLMSSLDALGICAFGSHYTLLKAMTLEDFPPLIEAATGLTFTVEDLEQCAERERIIQRSFNHLLGLDRKDDYPPQHTFEYPIKVHFRGKDMEFTLDKQMYGKVLSEFYGLCGYDEKTGIPTRETLEKFGLENVAEDLAKRGILPE
jgi:aldehyde:ferredoxin oxidoreductase